MLKQVMINQALTCPKKLLSFIFLFTFFLAITQPNKETAKERFKNFQNFQKGDSVKPGLFMAQMKREGMMIQFQLRKAILQSEVFSSQFTGFSLYDIEKDKYVFEYEADKYFTPASNVKTLTLYTVLKTFGDKLPSILYRETSDTLYLRPIGNPLLLHKDFEDNQPIIDLIKNSSKAIAIEWPNAPLDYFGNGWMWDDYHTRYQPELSWMPVFGNVAYFSYYQGKLDTEPTTFKKLAKINRTNDAPYNHVKRLEDENIFNVNIKQSKWRLRTYVPYKYSNDFAVKMLEDELDKTIHLTHQRNHVMDTLYKQALDPVLTQMMQESDNFIAEQLLIMAAWKNGFDDFQDFREFVIEQWLKDIKPIWRDGSGMSRYNMIKPKDMVILFNKLLKDYGWERLSPILAQGGVAGTIEDWYGNDENPKEPYIFGKTGTLSNNHILSGFLVTKSDKKLIFSIMNNHFVRPNKEVKQEMEKVLEMIRDTY